jgi:hypothetical protein
MKPIALCFLVALASCGREPPLDCMAGLIVPVTKDGKASSYGANISSCVDHYAAMLGSSPDSPYSVADAVVETCSMNITFQAVLLSHEEPGLYPDSDKTEADLRASYRRQALADIERFRAAKCEKALDLTQK